MKNVLIPTDFSLESLHVLKHVLNNSENGEKYNIVLLNGCHLTDSITDLMFFSRSKQIHELSNDTFDEALKVIKNKFSSKINSIRKDVFSGYHQNAFNNYLEANRIDEAYISASYSMNMENQSSFDIVPFLQKSKIPVNPVQLSIRKAVPEKGKVAEIFYNEAEVSVMN